VKRDFARLLTEQRNPRTGRIDALPVAEIIDLLNREDATIAAAVGPRRRRSRAA
jgi:N-acetylmuramic acid 6-phosphate (MurNAc-6-P) etherase